MDRNSKPGRARGAAILAVAVVCVTAAVVAAMTEPVVGGMVADAASATGGAPRWLLCALSVAASALAVATLTPSGIIAGTMMAGVASAVCG